MTHLAVEAGGGAVVGDQQADERDTVTVMDIAMAVDNVKGAGSVRVGAEAGTDERSQEWRTWPETLLLARSPSQASSGEVHREAPEWCTR